MIDARAVIDARARLDVDVTVGPFAVIGPDVEIGPGTWIGPHVVINGPTRIGRDNHIHQFASLGDAPQDKKYAGEPTRLEIGNGNTIREYVTINRGTVQDQGVTRVGDDNWIMAYVHIAHDCVLGNHIIMANGASLAGHVTIEDHVILGGFTMVHQFCRIGVHAFTAFSTGVAKDIPPYMMVAGAPGRPRSINTEGLQRRGFDAQTIQQLRQAFKTLYTSKLRLEEAIGRLRVMSESCAEIKPLVEFLLASKRSIIR